VPSALSKTCHAAAAVLAGLLAAPQARSAAECGIAVGGLAYGVYDVLSAQANDSSTDIRITCSHVLGDRGGNTRVLYSLALSAGNSGSFGPRYLSSGIDRLPYNLFLDPARRLIWGDGTAGTRIDSGSMRVSRGHGNRSQTQTHTVYGRIPPQHDVAPGSYSDTIYVTVSF
jgi:spore coat protein U-like protein